MKVIADTHLHFYPCFSVELGLNTLADNLSGIESGGIMAGFLSERYDCSFLAALRNGSIKPGGVIRIETAPDGTVMAHMGDGRSIYLVPGRQIVTSERLEILALATDCMFRDGEPADATIRAVRERGGVPVLSWAPGKWFFERGMAVRRLIENCSAGELLIGDTSLRPCLWAEPRLMVLGREKGLSIVAGSDPLPFAGEERQMGKYATTMTGEFERTAPLESFRRMLSSPAPEKIRSGSRDCVFETALRLLRNARAKNA